MARLIPQLPLMFLAFLALPALFTLGRWAEAPIGVDAVSAVTPGHVSVVGARPLPTTLTAAAADSLVRRVLFLSGGIHAVFPADAGWILVRSGHPEDTEARQRHMLLLGAVLRAIDDAVPGARLGLLAGELDGTGDDWHETLDRYLQSPALAALKVGLLRLAAEETEPVTVPDGGLAGDLYDLPIALLECDALVNVVYDQTPLAGLHNLWGLTRLTAGGTPQPDSASLVDRALLAGVRFTVTEVATAVPAPLLLASRDGIALERIALATSGVVSDSLTMAPLRLAQERHLGNAFLADIKVSGVEVAGTWAEPGGNR